MPHCRQIPAAVSDTDADRSSESEFLGCSLSDLEAIGFCSIVHNNGRAVEKNDGSTAGNVSSRHRQKLIALCDEVIAAKKYDKLESSSDEIAEQRVVEFRILWNAVGPHCTQYEQAKFMSILGLLEAYYAKKNTNRWRRILTDFRSYILSQSDSQSENARDDCSPGSIAYKQMTNMEPSGFAMMAQDAKSAMCNIIAGLDSKYMHYKAPKLARKRACDAISRVLENQRLCRRAMSEGRLSTYFPIPNCEFKPPVAKTGFKNAASSQQTEGSNTANPETDLVVLPAVNESWMSVLIPKQEKRVEEILKKLSHGVSSTTGPRQFFWSSHLNCDESETVLPCDGVVEVASGGSALATRPNQTPISDGDTNSDFRPVISKNSRRNQKTRTEGNKSPRESASEVAGSEVRDNEPSANRKYGENRPACCYFLLGKCEYGRQCVFWHPPSGVEFDRIVCKYGRVCHVNHGKSVGDQEHALVLGRFLQGEYGDFETDRVRHYLKVSQLDGLVQDKNVPVPREDRTIPAHIIAQWNTICESCDGRELSFVNAAWRRKYEENFPFERLGFDSLRLAIEAFPNVKVVRQQRAASSANTAWGASAANQTGELYVVRIAQPQPKVNNKSQSEESIKDGTPVDGRPSTPSAPLTEVNNNKTSPVGKAPSVTLPKPPFVVLRRPAAAANVVNGSTTSRTTTEGQNNAEGRTEDTPNSALPQSFARVISTAVCNMSKKSAPKNETSYPVAQDTSTTSSGFPTLAAATYANAVKQGVAAASAKATSQANQVSKAARECVSNSAQKSTAAQNTVNAPPNKSKMPPSQSKHHSEYAEEDLPTCEPSVVLPDGHADETTQDDVFCGMIPPPPPVAPPPLFSPTSRNNSWTKVPDSTDGVRWTPPPPPVGNDVVHMHGVAEHAVAPHCRDLYYSKDHAVDSQPFQQKTPHQRTVAMDNYNFSSGGSSQVVLCPQFAHPPDVHDTSYPVACLHSTVHADQISNRTSSSSPPVIIRKLHVDNVVEWPSLYSGIRQMSSPPPVVCRVCNMLLYNPMLLPCAHLICADCVATRTVTPQSTDDNKQTNRPRYVACAECGNYWDRSEVIFPSAGATISTDIKRVLHLLRNLHVSCGAKRRNMSGQVVGESCSWVGSYEQYVLMHAPVCLTERTGHPRRGSRHLQANHQRNVIGSGQFSTSPDTNEYTSQSASTCIHQSGTPYFGTPSAIRHEVNIHHDSSRSGSASTPPPAFSYQPMRSTCMNQKVAPDSSQSPQKTSMPSFYTVGRSPRPDIDDSSQSKVTDMPDGPLVFDRRNNMQPSHHPQDYFARCDEPRSAHDGLDRVQYAPNHTNMRHRDATGMPHPQWDHTKDVTPPGVLQQRSTTTWVPQHGVLPEGPNNHFLRQNPPWVHSGHNPSAVVRSDVSHEHVVYFPPMVHPSVVGLATDEEEEHFM